MDRRLSKLWHWGYYNRSKSSMLTSLAVKNVSQVFLGFLDFSSVPRFSAFLVVTGNAVVLDD